MKAITRTDRSMAAVQRESDSEVGAIFRRWMLGMHCVVCSNSPSGILFLPSAEYQH